MNKYTFSKIKKVDSSLPLWGKTTGGQLPFCDIAPTVYKMQLFQHKLPFHDLHRDAFNKTKPTLLKAHREVLLNDFLLGSSLLCPLGNLKGKTIGGQLPFPGNKSYLSRFDSRLVTNVSKRDSSYYTDKDKVVSITYEEIGLFPRSFSRVLDRFLKQLFSDVDNLVIQEYRFYRYLFLTTLKTIFILFFVPFIVNFAAKNYVVKPITEYFWNTSHPEIFLNSYEQKRAFAELEKFEEKIYFETLVESHSQHSPSFKIKESSTLPGGQHTSVQLTPDSQTQDNNVVVWNNFDEEKRSPSFAPSVAQRAKQETDIFIPSVSVALSPSGKQLCPPLPHTGQSNSFTLPLWGKTEGEKDTRCRTPGGGKEGASPSFSPMQTERNVSDLTSGFEQRQYFRLNSSELQKQKVEGDIPLENKAKVETTRNNFIRKNKDISKIYQEKTIELATYYNNHSIEAITNFFADLFSLCTLLYLLITLEIQINITKSFLLEVFFGLDDSKKSLLILLITDLLVGYHSSNLWELFFEFIFNHYGIPESQTGIFLLVATLPVLLDVLFKYLIFRHLNRSSPATVATYQAIIE